MAYPTNTSNLSWRNAALASSMELISKLGSHDPFNSKSLMADDVLYMTPRTTVPSRGSTEFAREIEELSKLDGFRIVPTRITLDAVDLSTESWLVAARYSIAQSENDKGDASPSVQQSMIWTVDDSQPGVNVKLAACHASLMEDQSSGANVSAESIRSFANEFARASDARTGSNQRGSAREAKVALQARDSRGLTHWVQPSSVVYVEAAHQYTNVYCRDRSIRLRSPFSTVVDQLGGVVIKVHRSYAVNPAYVSTLENEMLYLVTGDKVPVPAKRIKEVRAALADRFAQLGMRE